jgi:hypothetical protein
MAKRYLVMNQAAGAATAPFQGVVTSATLFTLLQIVPATNSPLEIVEWNISFNGSALATPFACDLVETGTVAATVTASVVGDIMPYDDPNAPANTSGSSGVPLNLGTALTGYTSSAEGSITAQRVFDSQNVEPIGGYFKQFPLGERPAILPGHILRVRCHGDGATKAVATVVIQV